MLFFLKADLKISQTIYMSLLTKELLPEVHLNASFRLMSEFPLSEEESQIIRLEIDSVLHATHLNRNKNSEERRPQKKKTIPGGPHLNKAVRPSIFGLPSESSWSLRRPERGRVKS